MKTGLLIRNLLIGLFFTIAPTLDSFALTYYSRQNGGLWTNNNSWSTVGFGNATNTGTFPKSGDFVMIGNGYTVYINSNVSCNGLTIGQGTSGSLLFSPAGNYQLSVNGNVRILTGAQLSYNSALARSHQFLISGSIQNSGTIDFFVSPNAVVNTTFFGNTSSNVSGSGVFDMNAVTLDKTGFNTNFLKVLTTSFESGIRNLILNYGTYIHDNTSVYAVNPSASSYTIGPDVSVQIPKGVLSFCVNASTLFLQGKLFINGGILNVGDAAGNGGIRYNRLGATIPELNLTAGTVNITGGFCNRFGFTSDAARVRISNGTINLNVGSIGTPNSVFQINNSTQSEFTMSNGTLILEKPNTSGASVSDFDINGSSGAVNVTGGTVQFGNNSTPSNAKFNFTPYQNAVLPNFKVTGPGANTVFLYTSKNSTADFRLISLYIDKAKIFDVKPIVGFVGLGKSMTLVGNFDGIHAFYNDGTFSEENSTVIMEANEGQWIAGNTLTTFYNFKINNSFGVSLGKSMNVSNTLDLFNGIIYTNTTDYLTCLVTSTNTMGSPSSYIDGPMAHIIATTSAKSINIPIGKNGAYRPINLNVHHTSMTPVTYMSEVQPFSAAALNYLLPTSLSLVSDVRYYTIDRTNVPNLQSSAITLSFGADDMVLDAASLRIARDNGSSAWIDLGGIGTANGTGTITSNGFTGFNRIFTLANARDGHNPLPLLTLDLLVQKTSEAVELNWSMVDESKVVKYEIYKSADANYFSLLSGLNANSISELKIQDKSPINGFNYYYVKAIYNDGSEISSTIKSVKWNKELNADIYPNPSYNSDLNVQLSNIELTQVSVNISTLTGQVVYQEIVNLNNGKFSIPSSEFTAGTYLIKVADKNEVYFTKQWMLIK